MKRRTPYSYYTLIFFTAVIALLPVALLRHPLKYDIIDQAYPWRYFIGECLREGTLPLWNPYQLLGSPIHADPQSSAWYPVTWFFGYVFGYDIYVLSIDFLLHIFLAGMGMFYLAKQLKFKDETAFAMAISYMLSGFFIGNAQHFMWIISGTWIPFIIGAFLSLKNAPSAGAAVRLGLAFFMIMTGGYPAFVFLLLFLLTAIFILVVIEFIRKEDYPGLTRFSGFLAIAALFTILSGMVVFISVYHLQDAMTRGAGVTLRQALFGAFTPRSFISFILPFASIRNMEYYGTDLSMSNAYTGLLILVFFLAGLMTRRTKLVNLFLAWGLFCLAAAVGSALPVREFLYHYVPFMNLFRFPALFRIFFILAFIIVAGYAFDEWRKDARGILLKIRISLLILSLVLLGFIIRSLSKDGLHFADFITNQLFTASETSTIIQHILFQAIIQLIVLVFLFLLFSTWKFKKHALAAILFISAADMILATQLNAPYTVYYQNFRSKEIDGHASLFPKGFPVPGPGPVIENKDSRGLSYKALWRNLNIFHKQVSYEGYNPLHLKGFEEIADHHPELFATILQNPPVYLSAKASPLDSLAIHEQGRDFHKSRVYVDEEDYVRLNAKGLGLNEGDTVLITAFSPKEVKVVSKACNKVLVNLLQNNYYGWKASIDGQPVDIMTVNLSFMAVLAPAGEHEILFSYDPQGVRVGFWVSVLALVLGIVLIFLNPKGKPDSSG
ncbi:MAG: YfhO family protein [Bacteroidales bacterium]|jgi:hypothetical protein|nr:YfhO family protein [Bacteroidales bacterium]